MPFEYINVSEHEHIYTIELARPEVLNAINQEMHDELQQAFDDFAANDNMYLAVVRGAGERAFSAGSDLKAIVESREAEHLPKKWVCGID